MDYLISALVGIAICVVSWIGAGYYWKWYYKMKGRTDDRDRKDKGIDILFRLISTRKR